MYFGDFAPWFQRVMIDVIARLNVETLIVLDDGDLSRMLARKLKNFLAAKKKYGMTTEMYTSCKCVQGEFRSCADNKVNLDKEQHMKVDQKRVPAITNSRHWEKSQFQKVPAIANSRD